MAYYKKKSYDGPSAEDKAMDRFTELLIDKIKTIEQDWEKPWLSPAAMKWPVNLDGRKYCGSNALMLMLHAEKEGYGVPVYATFNRIVGMNYKTDKDGNKSPLVDEKGEALPTVAVKKGEKSMPVFLTSYTVVNKDTKEKIPYEDYKKLSKEEQKDWSVYAKLNVYNVFNVAAQTNLEEARPELFAKLQEQSEQGRAKMPEGERFHLPVVDEMIAKQAWYCPIELNDGDNAYYSLSQDKVVLPEPKFFKDGESFIGTLMHECAHSTGSADRFNRFKEGTTFGDNLYSIEELRAELTSALVCSNLGITKHVKSDSAAYLKSWLDHMQESPEYLKTVLNDVKRATYVINSRLDTIQQQIDQYQSFPGRENEYPDIYDVDLDGQFGEVAHADRPFERMENEEVPFQSTRRGR